MSMPDPERSGSNYVDDAGARAYSQALHGPDGALLLDPVFTRYIAKYAPGNEVIDEGCGAAPWAVLAAEVGAKSVYAFDNSEHMLSRASEAVQAQPAEIRSKIEILQADVVDVPRPSESFDIAMSINVGCALPTILPSDSPKPYDRHSHLATPLLAHFQEMARVMRPGGMGIVAAPASLEETFTTYGDEGEKVAKLEADLQELAGEDLAEMRMVVTANHKDILRASIVPNGRHWDLMQPTLSYAESKMGLPIDRKIPGLVVPNYFHSSEEYGMAMRLAGFKILSRIGKVLTPGQYTSETGLGSQYVTSNPFDVYLLRKPEA